MTSVDLLNPYEGNVLVEGLGPILSPADALALLAYSPKLPRSMDGVPNHVRMHHLMSVRDLYVPPIEGRQLQQTVDLMVRQGYRYRDPRQASTWGVVSGERQRQGLLIRPASAAAVEGLSGVGKTQACLRCLSCLGPQIIGHETFPRMEGGLQQMVWQSVEVPPAGRAGDLARSLMETWDNTTRGDRFVDWLAKEHVRDGMRALEEWRQVAVGHFLGVLHLDEVQNLFKLGTLRQRRSRQGSRDTPELSVVEDQVLRWLLYLTNSGQVPVLVSGTPDGIGALSKRLSTLGRLNTMGYHAIEPVTGPCAFLRALGDYQYVGQRIKLDDGLFSLLIDLTAGIQRFLIALWVAAHRVAFERGTDSLLLADFTTAAGTYLAPLAPAVQALRSKDGAKMARFEDLVQRDTTFWAKFWTGMAAPV